MNTILLPDRVVAKLFWREKLLEFTTNSSHLKHKYTAFLSRKLWKTTNSWTKRLRIFITTKFSLRYPPLCVFKWIVTRKTSKFWPIATSSSSLHTLLHSLNWLVLWCIRMVVFCLFAVHKLWKRWNCWQLCAKKSPLWWWPTLTGIGLSTAMQF